MTRRLTNSLDMTVLPKQQAMTLDLSELEELVQKVEDGKQSPQELAYLLDLIKAYEEKIEISGMEKWFVPNSIYSIDSCPKHKAFFDAGATYHERLFMAANRSGKSVSGALEAAYHLTGLYPDWWTGRRFDRPVNLWACGQTGQTTRDTVQKELLGPITAVGTGMIPKDLILGMSSRPGVPKGVDTARVRHVSGGTSVLGFKSFDQDIKAFMGTAMDVVWWDEECPADIYGEMSTRLMTTNGIIYGTFTPLHGLTPLIINFSKTADYLAGARRLLALASKETKEEEEEKQWDVQANKKNYRAVIQAGWDDAPWLTQESKERMYKTTLPHMIEARSKGVPSLGSGAVYPVPIEQIVVPPFKIPDYYRRMYALDVGWNKTAALLCAIDPDTDTIYITHEYYVGDVRPEIHGLSLKTWGDWIPGVIDPASRGRSPTDGNKLMSIYKADIGLNIRAANNEVQTGLAWTYERLSLGKIKVFSTCINFFEEYMLYRRDMDGRIIKENDHLMDCMRYIINNLQVATTKPTSAATGESYGEIRYRI